MLPVFGCLTWNPNCAMNGMALFGFTSFYDADPLIGGGIGWCGDAIACLSQGFSSMKDAPQA